MLFSHFAQLADSKALVSDHDKDAQVLPASADDGHNMNPAVKGTSFNEAGERPCSRSNATASSVTNTDPFLGESCSEVMSMLNVRMDGPA